MVSSKTTDPLPEPLPWWKFAMIDGVPVRSLIIALIVGTILTLINQGDRIFEGKQPVWWKVALTYCVPYCVSTYGAVTARLAAQVKAAAKRAGESAFKFPSRAASISQPQVVADASSHGIMRSGMDPALLEAEDQALQEAENGGTVTPCNFRRPGVAVMFRQRWCALTALLLLAWESPARGQLSQQEGDAVAKHAPVFYFHPGEEAYPCSIGYILDASAEGRSAINNTAVAFPAPLTPEQIVQDENEEPNTHLIIPPSIWAGFVPGRNTSYYSSPDNATVVAPLYVAVQHDPTNSYVDISYIALYAYQPGQAVRPADGWSTGALASVVGERGKKPYNMVVETYGTHQGDVERVVVRLSPDYSTILHVGFEQHGTLHWANKSSVRFENGTHPVSKVALNGHANYDAGSIGGKDWGGNVNGSSGDPDVWYSMIADNSFAQVIDLLPADGGVAGAVWRPFEQPSQLVRVDLTVADAVDPIDRLVDTLYGQTWALFRGHLGLINVTNSLTGGHRVGYSLAEAQAKEPLPAGDLKYVEAVYGIAEKQGLLSAGFKRGDAPLGLGARNYVYHNCTANSITADGVSTQCLPGPTAGRTSFVSTPRAASEG
ncbi:hypothetical protein WJX72_009427 [[Myrmecia] bisecta]|uniref:Uncharacterized protein n=1 Tax=[Myrmecia] bisecta TaxID=41462 RepID=A0AAW1P5V4_9CHLO